MLSRAPLLRLYPAASLKLHFCPLDASHPIKTETKMKRRKEPYLDLPYLGSDVLYWDVAYMRVYVPAGGSLRQRLVTIFSEMNCTLALVCVD